jgi:tetratricopeptide (TPR) repeat protein
VNLAHSVLGQGRFTANGRLYRDALTLEEARQRDDHSLLYRSLIGLATVLKEKGRFAEAEALAQRALDADHPDIAQRSIHQVDRTEKCIHGTLMSDWVSGLTLRSQVAPTEPLASALRSTDRMAFYRWDKKSGKPKPINTALTRPPRRAATRAVRGESLQELPPWFSRAT